MNDLEKYLDRVIGPKSAGLGAPQIPVQAPVGAPMPLESESDVEPTLNVAGAVRRRWYIVLLTFLVLCSIGIPAIFRGRFGSPPEGPPGSSCVSTRIDWLMQLVIEH